ncbi:MAG TPA: FG-GAP-like repeat-containing protein [Vicinamibacterales bacterium]|nr:FG-GAP-like repeat-containing protein [Vicinamibacterales bacterium]
MFPFKRVACSVATVLALACPILGHAVATPAAGSTVGQFEVQGGAASYTVPLAVPPGPGEMKPELSLSYNSNAGDGPLGRGWSISGLSVVSLCPQTIAQDGKYVPVSRALALAEQRYCLDGQRLIPTNGSYAGTGALTLRTEIDNGSLVTSGTRSAVPASFTVKTKAGQELRYGTSTGSRSPSGTASGSPQVIWHLETLFDASRNYMSFSYTSPTPSSGAMSERLIDQIQWGGNERTGDAHYAKVTFEYESRALSWYYVAGYRVERNRRLKAVHTFVNGAEVRTYKLAYGQLARTGEDTITSLTECGWKNSQEYCLAPTTFAWNQQPTGQYTTWANSGASASWGGDAYVRTGDFNGDGLTDIASPKGGNVYLQLAKPFGGFDQVNWTTTNNWPSNANRVLTGDFDGDGRTDFAFLDGSINSIRLKLARTSGTFVDSSYSLSPVNSSIYDKDYLTFVGDMNGDGRSDVVIFNDVADSATANAAYVFRKTDTGFAYESWQYTCQQWTCNLFGATPRENFTGDVNGDGITDFVGTDPLGVGYYIADPVNHTFMVDFKSAEISRSDKRMRWLADFDGDGLSEVGYVKELTSTQDMLYVSPPTSRGISDFIRYLPSPSTGVQPYAVPDAEKDWTWSFDYNGDGRADIITRQNQTLYVFQQSGSGFSSRAITVWGVNGEYAKTSLGDFNGDGLTDFAIHDSTNGNLDMWYSNRSVNTSGFMSPQQAEAAQPEAIATINAGDGTITQIVYASMAQAPAGETAGPSSYDSLLVAAPIWLVHEVWASHGAGAPSEMRGTRHKYFNLRGDSRGRGILGFSSESIEDLLTGDYEVSRYETTWPKNGMVLRKDNFLKDGTLTKTVEQVLGTVSTTAYGNVLPYVGTSTETVYDDVGTPLSITSTTQNPPDSYGNVGHIEMVTRDPSSTVRLTKATDNVYEAADTANWILGRLSSTTVTHTLQGNPKVITRKSAFTYYPAGGSRAGLLRTEIIEPDATSLSQRLQTEYEYDDYGNKSKVTASGYSRTGTAIPARITTNLAEVVNGQLRTTTTNALGHQVVTLRSLAHGQVVSVTDPNLITVTTDYDAFGRKIRQEQGTVWSAWEYADAPSLVPSATQMVIATDSAGARSVAYQDLLGRTVRKDTLALDGRTIYESSLYDEQGRIVLAHRPSFDTDSGATVNTFYDTRGRVDHIDAPGPNGTVATTSFTYDGLTTSTTDPLFHRRTEVRNVLGQIERVEESNGTVVLRHFYNAVGDLESTIDPIGQTTSIEYDVRGRKTRMLDPHLGEWKYAYNSFGEVEWQRDAALGVTLTSYDLLGRMYSRKDPGASAAAIWTYDTAAHGLGKLATMQDPSGYSESTLYNVMSLPYEVTTVVPNRGAPETFVTSMTYDNQNRLATTTRPGSFVTENVYNERGYLVAVRSPSDNAEEVYNDAALQARIDEILQLLPQYTAAVTNIQNQINAYKQAAIEAENDAALLTATTLDHMSAADQAYISAAKAAAATALANADAQAAIMNQLQGQADQFKSYVDFYIALESLPYTQEQHWVTLYSQRTAELEARIDTLESSVTYYRTSADNYTAQYDQQTNNWTTRQMQVLAPVIDDIEALETEAATAEASATDLADDLEAATANLARLQSQLAMLNANMSDSSHITWWRADQVDPEGRVTQELLGNGLFTKRDYDPRTGQLLSIQTGGSTLGSNGNVADIQDVGYEYDANNNVQSRWDLSVNLDTDYNYDALDRITLARTRHPTVTSLNKTKRWYYDDAGNITERTDNAQSRAYTYETTTVTAGSLSTSRKRLTNVSNVGDLIYDANGNATTIGGRTLVFDMNNMATSLANTTGSVQYVYNANRQRINKIESRGNKLWDTVYVGSYERTRQTGGGEGTIFEHRYPIMVGDRVVANRLRVVTAGVSARRAEYYHEDALNSVEVVTDSIGRLMKRYSYDAFGTRDDITTVGVVDPSVMRADPFDTLMLRGYTGHEHIGQMNLIHMNGRVYDASIGRFVSADPFIQNPNDTQGYSRYSYVRNNPLKYTDPSGHFLKGLFKAIKKFWRPLLAIAISCIPGINVMFAGFIGGMIVSGGDLKAGLIGALTAGAFNGIGSPYASMTKMANGVTRTMQAGDRIFRVLAHGAVGGLSSVAQGGKFGSGFLSSGFTAVASPAIGAMPNEFGQGMAAAVVGGTGSVLGGGKFANGAVTGAFLYAAKEFAAYTTRETDSLKRLACATSGQDCTSSRAVDERGVLRTDGTRGSDWTRNPTKEGNWLTESGMEREGSGDHLYDPGHALANKSLRYFVTDVSKIHDWFNSWNYSGDNGLYMSRGVGFDSGFQMYSFAGMPVAAVATLMGYAGNASPAMQNYFLNISRDD